MESVRFTGSACAASIRNEHATIRQLEAGVDQPRNATLVVVRGALEAAGVIFIDENGDGPGVRLKKAKST